MVQYMEATVRHREWDSPRKVKVADGATVQALLDEGGFLAHAVLVMKDGTPVPENMPVEDGAEYEVIVVASGG